MLSFFPQDVLDEILNLIESVSEGFPSYSFITFILFYLFPLFVTLFVHSCTSFHMKEGSFRIFSTAFSSSSKVVSHKKMSSKYL